MEEILPRTMKRWESYQSQLYKNAVLQAFQSMTKGRLELSIQGDPFPYSFGLGNKIKAQMFIQSESFFLDFIRHGERGFGESFVKGHWDSPDLSAVLRWFLLNIEGFSLASQNQNRDTVPLLPFLQGLHFLEAKLFGQKKQGFTKALAHHYELDRRFFSLMLDAGLSYSGGIFAPGDSLEEAQLRKHRTIADQLRLSPGDHILEIGSGWGSLALYLALCHPCKVTAVTLSEEQHLYLKQKVIELGLSSRVFPELRDYRSLNGHYDRIVSVEMLDSLEKEELAHFFRICHQCLKPKGIMLLQVLLTPERFDAEHDRNAEWLRTYISPGALTPSLSQLLRAANQDASFSATHLDDIGDSYCLTLRAWKQRFLASAPQIIKLGFDQTFFRSWLYYLNYAEAAFAHGLMTAAQLTMTRPMQRLEQDLPAQEKTARNSSDAPSLL